MRFSTVPQEVPAGVLQSDPIGNLRTRQISPPALNCMEATRMVAVAVPQLQKIGRLIDIVIRFLVHVDTVGSMLNVKLFAEIALMGKDFARVLRPMFRQWKQDTKHDRALLRQVRQNKCCCRFQDVWMLGIALGLFRGTSLSYKTWVYYPVTWMTSFRKHECFNWVSLDDHIYVSVRRVPLVVLGFYITACLSPRDRYSLSALCWCAKNWSSYQSGYSVVVVNSF